MDNSPRISQSELRRSLNLNIAAITFGMVFFTVFGAPVGSPLFAGFMRSLGAGDLIYGIVMALPVLGAVAQIFGSYFLEMTGKRKVLFLASGFIHRFFWIPVALIPLFIPASQQSIRIRSITAFITISAIANSITGVSFSSWMGALVPMEIKGRFFSRRTMISTISGAITGLIVGKVIDLVHGSLNGFAIVFIIAALFGAADIFCFFWIKHPPMEIPAEREPFLKLLTVPFSNSNYLKFICFVSLWSFGVNLAGPFFNVYMIEYLRMNYFTLSFFAQVVGNIATILCIRYWGRLSDRYGNKPITTLCCSVIILLPFLWFFASPTNYWIVLAINFLSGIFWPGYDMTTFNQSIWLAPEKNRSIYVANYTLITSVFGVALGYICGGAFMQYTRLFVDKLKIPFFMGQNLSSYHILFALSGVIRLAALTLLLPRIKEENASSTGKIIKDITSAIQSKVDMNV